MALKIKKNKNGQVGKLIELPPETVRGLHKLAQLKRMRVKPYMEVVLIEHEKKNKE